MIKIKNISGEIRQLHENEFQIDELLDITDRDWYIDSVISAIVDGDFEIHNTSGLVGNIAEQLKYLGGDIATIQGEVVPRAPKNEYALKPYGMCYSKIDSSDYIYDITLSNKDGSNITYSDCTTTPTFYDCITQNDGLIRDGVYNVNNNVITSFQGSLQNGDGLLIKPIDIDYKIVLAPNEDFDFIYLWGVYFDATNYGDSDIGRLQIVDTDGVGVAAGFYTQEEFNYLNSLHNNNGVIVREYDECWIRHISHIKEVNTPDSSPGQILVGLTLRLKYYPKDVTKTDIKVWIDYKITVKGN